MAEIVRARERECHARNSDFTGKVTLKAAVVHIQKYSPVDRAITDLGEVVSRGAATGGDCSRQAGRDDHGTVTQLRHVSGRRRGEADRVSARGQSGEAVRSVT